jgi:hypothetical protein
LREHRLDVDVDVRRELLRRRHRLQRRHGVRASR